MARLNVMCVTTFGSGDDTVRRTLFSVPAESLPPQFRSGARCIELISSWEEISWRDRHGPLKREEMEPFRQAFLVAHSLIGGAVEYSAAELNNVHIILREHCEIFP